MKNVDSKKCQNSVKKKDKKTSSMKILLVKCIETLYICTYINFKSFK